MRPPIPTPLDAFRARWTSRREELARFGAQVDGARLCDELLAELEIALKGEAQESVTLQAAASLSGYTVDHLARLIRTGKLHNAGRKHAPRVRRADLPYKQHGDAAQHRRSRYHSATDARSLVHRLRHGGGNGTE